ncbi:MAG: arylsulfatase [Woeseia sp.]
MFLLGCWPREEPPSPDSNTTQPTQSRPNILLIVADDLGYSEIGAYGGEIDTPALNSLARTGVRYTNFYAHATCSPSRAMLFSGMDSHLAGLGAMHGFEGPNQTGQPGYEGHLNERTVSLAKLLQDSGYKTYMAGKWHLGETPDNLPAAKGFDRYFIQTKGGPPGGHFNLDGARPGAKGIYFEDGADRTGTPVSDDFFSSDFYTAKLIEYLDTKREDDAPFFAYLAFSAPHIPVQAPESHIDLYRGQYDAGYDLIRQRRLNTMQRLGVIGEAAALSRRAPAVTAWDELNEEEQRDHARRMEVYAGAVDNMDDNIGRLLDYLRDSDEFDNTLILFMSDNGAAGFNGWQSARLVQQYNNADNSLENLGRDGSMMFYGPGWGSAGSTPFYLFKRHTTEGGILVPFIVSGPGVVQRGSISHELLTVRDVAPTLLDIAGIRYPVGSYEGREILPQSGKSFAAQLAGKRTAIHEATEIFGWEIFNRRGVRKGDWKAILLDPPFGTGQWQLFNLSTDPGEKRDLAQREPGKLSEMVTAWNAYAAENNVILSNGPQRWP